MWTALWFVGAFVLLWLHIGVLVTIILETELSGIVLWPVNVVTWITIKNRGQRQ